MPGKLRRLSGSDIVRILRGFGFEQVSQRGSHAKLRRIVGGRKETLHVPMHGELRSGTLLAIYRQAAEYVSVEELRPHFYSE